MLDLETGRTLTACAGHTSGVYKNGSRFSYNGAATPLQGGRDSLKSGSRPSYDHFAAGAGPGDRADADGVRGAHVGRVRQRIATPLQGGCGFLTMGSRLPYKEVTTPLRQKRDHYTVGSGPGDRADAAGVRGAHFGRVRKRIATPLQGGRNSLTRGSRLPYKWVATPLQPFYGRCWTWRQGGR